MFGDIYFILIYFCCFGKKCRLGSDDTDAPFYVRSRSRFFFCDAIRCALRGLFFFWLLLLLCYDGPEDRKSFSTCQFSHSHSLLTMLIYMEIHTP